VPEIFSFASAAGMMASNDKSPMLSPRRAMNAPQSFRKGFHKENSSKHQPCSQSAHWSGLLW
jgi:hypothetical protein